MRTPSRRLGTLFLLAAALGLAPWPAAFRAAAAEAPPPITLTILYDNTVAVPGTRADWGFSCLVRGTEKTILLDVGWKADVLFHNLEALKIDRKGIRTIVLSHAHTDHTGALVPFLGDDEDVTLYAPFSWPDEYLPGTLVLEPLEVCRNVFLTGAMGRSPVEQALVINTADGLVVVTGCAHPGIVGMVAKAKEMLGRPVDLVCGGFHLLDKTDDEVRRIIEDFRALGVKRVGATHCTGERQIALIREAYGPNFVPLGVGRVLELRSAPVGDGLHLKAKENVR